VANISRFAKQAIAYYSIYNHYGSRNVKRKLYLRVCPYQFHTSYNKQYNTNRINSSFWRVFHTTNIINQIPTRKNCATKAQKKAKFSFKVILTYLLTKFGFCYYWKAVISCFLILEFFESRKEKAAFNSGILVRIWTMYCIGLNWFGK